MSPLTQRVLELLPLYGPWLLFALAFLETCFLTGLIVPAGVATATGTVLALEETLRLPPVVAAVLAGGALGDTVGFWIGRFAGERYLTGDGSWARRLRRRDALLQRWFGHHPAVSVGLARVVAFVRTVMPMAAGVSRIGYLRFLTWELPGLAACVGLYVGIGVLAQGSLEAVTRWLGIGGALTLAATLAAVGWTLRRRIGRRGTRPLEEEPPC